MRRGFGAAPPKRIVIPMSEPVSSILGPSARGKKKRGLIGILPFLFRYPGAIALSVGLLLVNIAIEMWQPQIIGDAISRFGEFQATGQAFNVWPSVIGFMATVLVRMMVGMIMGPIRNRLVQRALADIRAAIFDAIQRLPFTYHDRVSSGELITRSTGDAWKLQDFLFACLFLSVDIAVALVATVTLIFAVNGWLGLVALGTLLPTLALITRYAIALQPKWRKVHDLHGAMTTVIQENIAGVRVVKAFAAEAAEVSKFRGRRDEFLKGMRQAIDFWAARVPFAQFLYGLSVPLALWIGGGMVIRNELRVGDLTKVLLYLMTIGHRLGAVGQFTNIVQNASAAAERILEVVDEPRTIVGGTTPLSAPSSGVSAGLDVEFQGVGFAYTAGKPVLRDLTFRVPAGSTVGIVGPTGSGKSTLVSLIPRFHDPTQGTVRIQGVDVRQFPLAELRRAIGFVFQETYLFSATVADNIALGRPDATRLEIEAAARMARAHDFIFGLEKGYDTLVGERGVTLSGGQKQRLGLARAFLVRPRLLILDDATASVDAATEHEIQDALASKEWGRTTFIISHRLSSVLHADLLLVLDAGGLVVAGPPSGLASQSAFLRDLLKRQQT